MTRHGFALDLRFDPRCGLSVTRLVAAKALRVKWMSKCNDDGIKTDAIQEELAFEFVMRVATGYLHHQSLTFAVMRSVEHTLYNQPCVSHDYDCIA
jgi:hypothetical protein